MLRLSDLLAGIDQGSIVLPNFQRDFVWSDADVRALLVTVLSGWPAGSLLLLEGEPTFFDVRRFEGGTLAVASSDIRYVVLDGQQRLTALYQALYHGGSYVYGVRLDAVRSEVNPIDALEEAVVSYRRATWEQRYASPTEQWQAKLLPLTALVSPPDYFAWRDQMLGAAPGDERDATASWLSELYRGLLSNVDAYEFPAVIVDNRLEPTGIARIFERVNRTGMTLSAFDLVVARVYERDWNLRDHWEETRADSSLIDRFLGEDGMPVLQTIALAYQGDVRQSAVLSLAPRLIREKWADAAAAVEAAILFFVRECGVLEREWLPYRAMVLPLAAIALDHDLTDHQALLRKWFWSRSFALAYDAAANTRVVADHKSLRRAIETQGGIRTQAASASTLFEATRRRQAPIWRAFLCALAYRDAQDPTEGSLGLSQARVQGEGLPDDVVVAQIFGRDVAGDDEEPVHLRVLNLILAKRTSARAIQRHGIFGALQEVGAPTPLQDNALETQFLPPSLSLATIERDWQALIEARLERLGEFLAAEAGQMIEVED